MRLLCSYLSPRWPSSMLVIFAHLKAGSWAHGSLTRINGILSSGFFLKESRGQEGGGGERRSWEFWGVPLLLPGGPRSAFLSEHPEGVSRNLWGYVAEGAHSPGLRVSVSRVLSTDVNQVICGSRTEIGIQLAGFNRKTLSVGRAENLFLAEVTKRRNIAKK